MKVQISAETDHYQVAISGELDASSSIMLDNAFETIMAGPPKTILVDCTELRYISSPGLGVFVSRLGDCEQRGVRLGLFGMSEKISKVFNILGLDQLLVIAPTKHEAQLNIDGTQPANRV
jgi:anti-sigma B factor antagonist